MSGRSTRYDVIVVGLGGMGSATVFHLTRRGRKVLGLGRYDIPNEMGSSHGVTRIIRLAYYEHPSYVPLLRRAYELWRELQQLAGEQLLYTTGSIDASWPDGPIFQGSRRSWEIHHLPHEILTSAQLTRRFPGHRLPPETTAMWQPDGGFLLREHCIVSHHFILDLHPRYPQVCIASPCSGHGFKFSSVVGEIRPTWPNEARRVTTFPCSAWLGSARNRKFRSLARGFAEGKHANAFCRP